MPKDEVILQRSRFDCGLASLLMIAHHHGIAETFAQFEQTNGIVKHPWSASDLLTHAEQLNLSGIGIELDAAELTKLDLPCILHWRFEHFVVLRKITSRGYLIDDPALGRLQMNQEALMDGFTGVALRFSAQPGASAQTAAQIRGANTPASMGTIAPARVTTALISAALTACTPLIIKFIIDEVITSGDMDLLHVAIFALIVTALLAAVLDWAEEHQLLRQTHSFHRACHTKFLTLFLKTDTSKSSKHQDSHRELAAFRDLPGLCQFYNRDATSAAASALIILGYLGIMGTVDVGSALILGATSAVVIFINLQTRATIYTAELSEQHNQQRFQIHLNEAIQHKKLIHQYDAAIDFIKGNDLRLEGFHDAMRQLKAKHWQAILQGQFLNQMAHAGLLYWVCTQIFAGALSIGSLYLILTFRAQLTAQSLNVNHYLRETLSRARTANRLPQFPATSGVSRLLQNQPRATQKKTASARKAGFLESIALPQPGTLCFWKLKDHQSFTQVAQDLCNKGFSPGQAWGELQPWTGSDRSVPIGVISRHTPIFDGSITANITLFSSNPNLERVQKVVDLTGLNPVIKRHSLGLATRICPDQHHFDVKMMQQLGLARALYAAPQAVIIEIHSTTLNDEILQRTLRQLLILRLSVLLLSNETVEPLPGLNTVLGQKQNWQQFNAAPCYPDTP